VSLACVRGLGRTIDEDGAVPQRMGWAILAVIGARMCGLMASGQLRRSIAYRVVTMFTNFYLCIPGSACV